MPVRRGFVGCGRRFPWTGTSTPWALFQDEDERRHISFCGQFSGISLGEDRDGCLASGTSQTHFRLLIDLDWTTLPCVLRMKDCEVRYVSIQSQSQYPDLCKGR
eukprot:4783734-Heterocapsa_arctica.AAC.1